MLDGDELVVRAATGLHGRADRGPDHRRGHVPRVGPPTRSVGDPGRRAGGSAIRPDGPRARDALDRRGAAPSPREDGRPADRHLARARLLRAGGSRDAGAPVGGAVVGPQSRRGVRVEAPAGRGARAVRDDLPGRRHRHRVDVAGGRLPGCEPRVRADVRLHDGRASHDDVARLHPSGGHRAQREDVPGDDGRNARLVRDREALLPQGRAAGVGPRRRGAAARARRRAAVRDLDGREHHGAQGSRAPDRVPGVPRRAHGPGEPFSLPRGARERHRPRAPARIWPSASSSWTWTTSSS